jgi:hypothetical protein
MKFLTPFVYIALAVTLFFMVIKPEYDEIKKINIRIAENNRLLQLASELRTNQDSLQKRNVAIGQDERRILERILPDAVDNVKLILDIQNLDKTIVVKNIGIAGETENSNAALTGSRSKNLSGNDKYGSIQLSFSFSTNYENVKSFIRKLEDSLRLVDITELKISSSNTTDAIRQYNVGVKLNTYWLRTLKF